MSDVLGILMGLLPEGTTELPEDIASELKKEIERNEIAVKLVKQREEEAIEAKKRAENSKIQMENMVNKYEDMRRKLERTKQTLAHTKDRIESHNLLKCKVQTLRKLAADLTDKQKRQLRMDNSEAAETLSRYTKPDYAKTVESLSEKLETDGKAYMRSVDLLEQEKNEAVSNACQKEKDAKAALALAEKKEQEAREMKRKLESMKLILTESNNKLLATEDQIKKKGNVVEKVNKILHTKERRAKFVESQKIAAIVFDKKPQK